LLDSLPNFDEATLETSMRKLCDDLALKPNQLFTIVRNAVSGKTITPPLFGVLNVIGRDVTLERLSRAEKQLGG
jgi:glutamyl-tRNA synthetase